MVKNLNLLIITGGWGGGGEGKGKGMVDEERIFIKIFFH